MEQFKPHVTTAWVVKAQNCYLLVEEYPDGEQVFNQPAGHLEAEESLIECAKRELFEETGLEGVEPDGIIGIYQTTGLKDGISYLRFCFAARLPQQFSLIPQDSDIHAAHWLTREQITRLPLRSELVLRCIDDYEQSPLYSDQILRKPTVAK